MLNELIEKLTQDIIIYRVLLFLMILSKVKIVLDRVELALVL